MERDGDEVHIDTEEVSGGDKDKSMSLVLIIGTVLAIALLSAVWISGAVRFDTVNTPTADASSNP